MEPCFSMINVQVILKLQSSTVDSIQSWFDRWKRTAQATSLCADFMIHRWECTVKRCFAGRQQHPRRWNAYFCRRWCHHCNPRTHAEQLVSPLVKHCSFWFAPWAVVILGNIQLDRNCVGIIPIHVDNFMLLKQAKLSLPGPSSFRLIILHKAFSTSDKWTCCRMWCEPSFWKYQRICFGSFSGDVIYESA